MKTDPLILSFPFSSKDRLILGVSGGSDSLGLLYLLLERLPRATRRLVVAHVNYGLRGRASDKDEAFLRAICKKEGLAFRALKVKGFLTKARIQKRSPQDLAREIRYAFFQKLAQDHRAWGVAVGHHLEDQGETILDRLLRGSGSRGLSGLRTIQVLRFLPGQMGLRVWRPLLSFSKGQIQDLLRQKGVAWREDRSNRQAKYRRNQIRQEVLPFLMRWNPGLPKALGKMAEVTAAEDAFLESLLAPLGRKVGSRWARSGYSCRAKDFEKLPTALKRRWVRAVAERLSGEARGLSFDRIEEVLRLWEGREKGPRDLGFGLLAGRDRGQAYLRSRPRA